MSVRTKGNILVGDDEIEVYLLDGAEGYTAVYRNSDTKRLDAKTKQISFPLNWYAIAGKQVNVLRYFTMIAAKLGYYVGLQERELRNHLKGYVRWFDESDLELELSLQDGCLKRLQVEGIDVILPVKL